MIMNRFHPFNLNPFHLNPFIRPNRQPVPAAGISVSTPYVLFGKDVTEPVTPAQLIQWYEKNIAPIQPLEGASRVQHGKHLAITAQLLGLMPPVNTAQEAFQLYKKVFNTVENTGVKNSKKIANAHQGQRAFRMHMHEQTIEKPVQGYGILPYGFHILLFAPNGAIETYRHLTPPSVAVDENTNTDFSLRVSYFNQVAKDVTRLKDTLRKRKYPNLSIPRMLADTTQYTRTIAQAGADGKDAWNKTVDWAQHPFKKQFETKNA